MVNIGEGKKFLTEWMDRHELTKKDVEKRKKDAKKAGRIWLKSRNGSLRQEMENHMFKNEDSENGFEHLMKSTG